MAMSEQDIQVTEDRFRELLSEMKKGTTRAVFMVVVDKDDQATTFFTGEDGQQAVVGPICMSKVWEWLLRNGLIMAQPHIIALGQLLRAVR